MPPIPDSQWQPIRDHVGDGLAEDEWREAVRRLPPGARVEGRVLGRLPMGFWMSLGERLAGQVEATSIIDEQRPLRDSDWPAIGSTVVAKVLDHRADGRRVRLTVRPSDLAVR